jgi:hypothetical protein
VDDGNLPEDDVGSTTKIESLDVQRIGIVISEEAGQSAGQLLVEEQAHVGLRGGDAQRPALAFRGIRQTRTDVVMRQLRKVRE